MTMKMTMKMAMKMKTAMIMTIWRSLQLTMIVIAKIE